ncbi:MAG: hypothetical protein QOH62_2607 [Solirubrobacteraceae bacterium]|jgi:glycosyltransferase involved in cell wall biosynthesis|nr:hypothetical protein [Solirubrobacteraceae bacterium]
MFGADQRLVPVRPNVEDPRERMRLAAYTDDPYVRSGDSVGAVMPFALFLAAMGEHVDRFVLLGRVASDRGQVPVALPAGVEVRELPWWEDLSRPAGFLGAVPGSLRAFWAVLGEVDTVLLFGPSPLGLLFAALTRLRGRRLAIGVRMDYLGYVRHRHPGRRGLLAVAQASELAWRALARFVPTVVVGSELADRYRNARRLLDTSISLVGEADIADPGRAAPGTSGPVRILSVGRIDVEKNPLLLAEILADLVGGGGAWHLVVCGDGPMTAALADRLEALGVSRHAELAGFVGRSDELRKRYRSADVFLHVSWTEGVPQVLSEAWGSALPVVATDVGGVRAAAGPAAALVPPGDAAAACAAVRRVVADDDLRARLVEHGLERARNRTRESTTAEVVAFLGGAASPMPGRAG